MLRRIWHRVFIGHQWAEVSRVTCGGTGQVPHHMLCGMTNDDHRMEVYGFTEINETCPCGATRKRRMVGVRQTPAVDAELESLRRMIK